MKIAICSYSLSNNAAGRAIALADLYRHTGYNVEIIGSIFPSFGEEVWEPLRGSATPVKYIKIRKDRYFFIQALWFVLWHRYDVVHLSKPRFPNIIFGLLYKVIWNAKVIVDIDDEELSFGKGAVPISPGTYLSEHTLPALKKLRNVFWTGLGVGCVECFDAVTVSNPALQNRYGGMMIPHVRSTAAFIPSSERTARSRMKFGISDNAIVVLFFGTPRRHKGLIETAQALRDIGRDDVCFVIIGEFPEADLKSDLLSINGVKYRFIDNQPYDTIPDVVAMGDVCVLMQENTSEVAQFQLPAKLIDAIAMGLKVLLSVTPATQFLADAGVVIPVTPDNLADKLSQALSELGNRENALILHEYFKACLSIESHCHLINILMATNNNKRLKFKEKLDILLSFNQREYIQKTILHLIKGTQ